MKKRFSTFPEPQKLKNYDFPLFLGTTNLKILIFLKNLKFSWNPKMFKKQFKHVIRRTNSKKKEKLREFHQKHQKTQNSRKSPKRLFLTFWEIS